MPREPFDRTASIAWAVILCLLGAYLIALGALIVWSLT
jgi:hypothetical protein